MRESYRCSFALKAGCAVSLLGLVMALAPVAQAEPADKTHEAAFTLTLTRHLSILAPVASAKKTPSPAPANVPELITEDLTQHAPENQPALDENAKAAMQQGRATVYPVMPPLPRRDKPAKAAKPAPRGNGVSVDNRLDALPRPHEALTPAEEVVDEGVPI